MGWCSNESSAMKLTKRLPACRRLDVSMMACLQGPTVPTLPKQSPIYIAFSRRRLPILQQLHAAGVDLTSPQLWITMPVSTSHLPCSER